MPHAKAAKEELDLEIFKHEVAEIAERTPRGRDGHRLKEFAP
jgi:hypothetical protein